MPAPHKEKGLAWLSGNLQRADDTVQGTGDTTLQSRQGNRHDDCDQGDDQGILGQTLSFFFLQERADFIPHIVSSVVCPAVKRPRTG